MLSRMCSVGRTLSIVGAFLRHVGRRSTTGVRSKVPAVEVTLFRLIIILPGARHDQRNKP